MDVVSIIIGIVIGAAGAFALLRVVRPSPPAPKSVELGELVKEIRQDDPGLAEALAAQPVMEPEAIPEVVSLADLKRPDIMRKIESLPAPAHALRAVYGAMRDWTPRSRDGRESGYERSFIYLLKRADLGRRMAIKKRFTVSQKPGERARWIQPDVVIDGNLLLELKADLIQAAASDRSLGQILRYLVHWKTRGPALLVVCGKCDPLTKDMMCRYVRIWRTELKLPVGIVFAAYEGPDADAADTDYDAALEAQLAEASAPG